MRRYRIRKLIAPTRGLQQAFLFFTLGQIAFVLGVGLSFKDFIRPILTGLSARIQGGVAEFVPANNVAVTTHYLAGILMLIGGWLSFRGIRSAIAHIVETLNPGLKSGKVDRYLQRLRLAQGPKIVAIGGGTGLSTLLRGLKQETSNITAIVTVTDDGGSSGKLIKDKGMIPPGDIRNCLVALADAEKAMTDLFQHRFTNSGALTGHSLGNLLIAGLTDQNDKDFERALEIASDVLNIRGRVLPSTLEHVRLAATFSDGRTEYGETNIVEQHKEIKSLELEPKDPAAHPSAIEAIRQADLICIGPGSVYTSLIPNLLVPGIAEAIAASTAIKVYICNVMTQPGESEGFTASRHVAAIVDCVRERVFDYVLINTAIPTEQAVAKYQGSGQHLVEADEDMIRKQGFRMIRGNFMSETDVIRHDPVKVTNRLMKLLSD
jgi:uncharacterized cofD-like protein